MNEQPEAQPATVSETTPQAGDIYHRWWWVELSVWTERMLTALENGVKGSKWFRLIDKVYAPRNMLAAFWAVWRNEGSAGVDRQTIEQFEAQHTEELGKLSQQVQERSYRPHPVRRVWINKMGSHEKRPLGIPAVRDRVVQAALKQVIEPIFEREFAETSYGFRPGRGCQQALERVEGLLQAGYTWVVDADLKSYFDTIPHERLLARVQERIADGRVLALIDAFLRQGVMEAMKGWQPTERGTPQGSVISPLLANVYLNPLDHQMVSQGWEMTRYADDFVIQCRSQAEARAALEAVQQWVESEGLQLHPTKTRIVDATQPGGFDFLGFHYERGYQWPRQKSQDKLKETIRIKTPRTSGVSLEEIIRRVNRTVRGWHAYFRRSLRNVLEGLDQMIRRRLRSILMKRHRKRGIDWRQANRLWPNAYFTKRGLYTMAPALVTGRQSR
jgi:RNA-directed DNA polymerase